MKRSTAPGDEIVAATRRGTLVPKTAANRRSPSRRTIAPANRPHGSRRTAANAATDCASAWLSRLAGICKPPSGLGWRRRTPSSSGEASTTPIARRRQLVVPSSGLRRESDHLVSPRSTCRASCNQAAAAVGPTFVWSRSSRLPTFTTLSRLLALQLDAEPSLEIDDQVYHINRVETQSVAQIDAIVQSRDNRDLVCFELLDQNLPNRFAIHGCDLTP